MKSYHLSRRFRNPIHMFVIYLIRTNFRLGIILITIRKVMGYKEVEWSTMSVSMLGNILIHYLEGYHIMYGVQEN